MSYLKKNCLQEKENKQGQYLYLVFTSSLVSGWKEMDSIYIVGTRDVEFEEKFSGGQKQLP